MSTSKPVLAILGGAESGVGAARLGLRQGWEVFLSERGDLKPAFRQQVEALGIPYETGGHNLERLLAADLVIKSPGIPQTAPVMQALYAANRPVVSEIEFAARYCTGKIIGVTGTNGKTTTVTLIHKVLQEGGVTVGLCGNVGNSFAAMVADEPPKDWYVVEISSFQLENIDTFRPHIAIITNLYENHLDRYNGSMERYGAAKLNLVRNQTVDDYFLYCLDSPALLQTLERAEFPLRALRLPYSLGERPDAVSYVTNLTIQFTMQNNPATKAKKGLHNLQTLPLENPALQSQHNQQNSMAAAITANIVGIRKESIRLSFSTFQNVDHRLQEVGEYEGVTYINDSKATNVNSVWYALESMHKPVIWVMGGVDKGNDYGMLLEVVKAKVKAIVILGNSNEAKIRDAFAPTGKPILQAENMEEAVMLARNQANAGDVVLLSPACASFDMFENYEARGHAFAAVVDTLR